MFDKEEGGGLGLDPGDGGAPGGHLLTEAAFCGSRAWLKNFFS